VGVRGGEGVRIGVGVEGCTIFCSVCLCTLPHSTCVHSACVHSACVHYHTLPVYTTTLYLCTLPHSTCVILAPWS
jgi:hypothetical protein